MDYDYSKRGYLLPDGYKDLIDVIELKPKTAITKRRFLVIAQLPERQSGDLEVTVEGGFLRIVAKPSGSHALFESTVEVPNGYAVANARAAYVNGELRILVPKAAVS